MSLWGEFIAEHRGDQILENEMGFVTYRYLNDKTVYIVDIYVKPDFRSTGLASTMADSVVDIAKRRGCSELLGTVTPSGKNSTISLKVLLGYGMELQSSDKDLIVFRKAI